MGCHFLKNLAAENRNKIFRNYAGFFILQGIGSYTDSNGTVSELSAGDFVQHLPGRFHTIRRKPEPHWIEASISMDICLFQRFLALGAVDTDNAVIKNSLTPTIFDDFIKLNKRFRTSRDSDLFRLLPTVMNTLMQALPNTINTDSRTSALEEAMLALSGNFQTNVDVKQLVAGLGFSYSNFRRLFRKKTGMSPNEYRISARIQQAKLILAESSLSIKTISAMLGYADPFIFSRQFKKYTGESPRQFRSSEENIKNP